MKIKTQDLIGPALNWMVAKCEGYDAAVDGYGCIVNIDSVIARFEPSTNWCWGGPIIEREGISVVRGNDMYFPKGNAHGDYYEKLFIARLGDTKQWGPTVCIAAMRCHVTSKLGDEVDVPEELL